MASEQWPEWHGPSQLENDVDFVEADGARQLTPEEVEAMNAVRKEHVLQEVDNRISDLLEYVQREGVESESWRKLAKASEGLRGLAMYKEDTADAEKDN